MDTIKNKKLLICYSKKIASMYSFKISIKDFVNM